MRFDAHQNHPLLLSSIMSVANDQSTSDERTTRSKSASPMSSVMKPKEVLEQMTRDELLSYSINMNTLCEKLLTIEKRINVLESDKLVQSNVNNLLKQRADNLESRLVTLEKLNTNSAQYIRNRQLEVNNVPAEIDNQDLKSVMAKYLSLTGVPVTIDDLDKCHRLKKESVVIMELTSRTLRDSLLKGRTKLKDKGEALTELGLNKSFTNESMCPEFRKLDFVCRKLKKDGIVEETWFFNGRLHVVCADGKKSLIQHMNGVYKIAKHKCY